MSLVMNWIIKYFPGIWLTLNYADKIQIILALFASFSFKKRRPTLWI